jgi:hypothetical protein
MSSIPREDGVDGNFVDQSTSYEARPRIGPALLTLGIAGDWLVRGQGAGLNVALWVAAVVCTWHWVRTRSGTSPDGLERNLLIVALMLAGGWLWRENPLLRLLDLVGLAIVFALLPLAAAPEAVAFARLSAARVLRSALQLARRGAVGWIPTLFAPRAALPAGQSSVLGAVARGSLLAVPCLLVFGSLLGASDRVFGDFLASLVRVDPEQVVEHAVPTLGLAWLAAALLGGIDPREGTAVLGAPAIRGRGLGPIEVGMTLGTLDLLFAAFIAFQLPYLFGGAAWVERTAGVTLAEYARRGFFELAAVSALVLPMLLACEAWVETTTGAARRLYRLLAGTMLGLLLAIIASALHRMVVYQAEFGLTVDRVFATALIGGVAVTCWWFGATVLRGATRRFMPGALVGWGIWLLLLHAVNPERLVVATNMRRAAEGKRLDVSYLASLSPDAVPALVAAWPRLAHADRRLLATALRGQVADGGDLRGWNFSRRRAMRAVARLPHLPAGPPR